MNPVTPKTKRRRSVELFRVLAIMTAALLFVVWYFPKYYTPKAMPINPYLGPAVTFAFGEGFKDPIVPPNSKLAGFLNHSTPSSLSYDDVSHPIPGTPMSAFQRFYVYLIALIGLCWKIFGVNWAALGPLLGIMAAISVASFYGILRFRVRPFLAIPASLAILACPTQLALLHDTRDYSKTPVFFTLFFLIGVLITKSLSRRQIFLMGLALGIVTGLGYGIRQDSVVVWGVIPFIYAFFLPTGPFRMPLTRLFSLCVAFSLFIILSYPAMSARGSMGNSTAHHMIGGLFKYNSDTMGVGGAPYIWLNESLVTDSLINTLVQDSHRRITNTRTSVQYQGIEYEVAGQALYRNLLRYFPADFVTRFFAASLTVIRDGPWLIQGARETMYDISDPIIEEMQRLQHQIRLFWNTSGPWIVLLSLTLLSWHSLRLALATTALLIFFTGYTCLQFQPRHFWHLGVVFIGVATFVSEEFFRALGIAFKGWVEFKSTIRSAIGWQQAKRVGAYILILTIGISSLLGGTRAYQSKTVRELFEKYRTAQLLPGAVSSVNEVSRDVRVVRAIPAPRTSESDIRFRYDITYLAVTFDGSGLLPTSLTLLHDNFGSINPQQLVGGNGHAPATIFLPSLQGAEKVDFELRGGDPTNTISVYSIANPDAFPLSMVLALPTNISSLYTHNSLMPMRRIGMN